MMNHVERFYIDTKFPHTINLVKTAVYKSVPLTEKDWTGITSFNRQPKFEQELCASTMITSALLWVICCLSKEHPIIKLCYKQN